VILGEGVVVGDAVNLALDETAFEVHRERPTVDVNTLSMGTSDDFCVAVEEGTPLLRISRAIFGHLA
jgi:uncharacterized pyridoxal phosphate-containing UPF0001 family protein